MNNQTHSTAWTVTFVVVLTGLLRAVLYRAVEAWLDTVLYNAPPFTPIREGIFTLARYFESGQTLTRIPLVGSIPGGCGCLQPSN